MLTLKEKMQLFKLAKKPRKQIRLRLQVITNELNLPSVQKTTKQLNMTLCEKQQKVIGNINNFKKIDNVKHYANSLSKTIGSQGQQKQNRWVRQNQNKDNNKGQYSIYRGGGRRSQSNLRRVSHPNSNACELLESFDFNLSRKQKHRKTQSPMNEGISHKRESRSYYAENNKECIQLMGLKNELSSLVNLNRVYQQQLKHAKKVQRIEYNANRVSHIMTINNGSTHK